MGWMIAKERLDDTQRNIVSASASENTNLFIHGPAGCGKSVVLVHIVQEILDKNPEAGVVMISFTRALLELYKTGVRADLLNRVQFCTMEGFKKGNYRPCQFIVIDEIQDSDLHLLNIIKPSSCRVLVAGDFYQSIYDNKCALSDIQSLENIQQPLLPVIYRNTKSIHAIASFFAEFPEEYRAYDVDNKQQDTSVQLAEFSSKLKEIAYVWSKARLLAEGGDNVVIILPNQEKVLNFFSAVCLLESLNPWVLAHNRYNKPDYGALNSYCQQQKLPICYLGNSYGSLKRIYDENIVTVMTYHSAKGLDFDSVFLPELTHDAQLWNSSTIERRLFFVALTRARKSLFISYFGEPHAFIKLIPEHTVVKAKDITANEVVLDDDYEEIMF